MGLDTHVHAYLQKMVVAHEEDLKKEKHGEKRRRRNLERPGYSAIRGWASSVDKFLAFLEFHHIWVGITMDQMKEVRRRTSMVQLYCSKKV